MWWWWQKSHMWERFRKMFRPVYYVRSPAGRCRNKLEVLARPRPIKLRVNLAPQMIEGGASPVEKNFRGSCFCLFFVCPSQGKDGIITSSRLLLFSSYCKKTREESCQGRGKNIMQTFLSHAMHIQLFRLQKKHTSNHFPSNFLLSSS